MLHTERARELWAVATQCYTVLQWWFIAATSYTIQIISMSFYLATAKGLFKCRHVIMREVIIPHIRTTVPFYISLLVMNEGLCTKSHQIFNNQKKTKQTNNIEKHDVDHPGHKGLRDS